MPLISSVSHLIFINKICVSVLFHQACRLHTSPPLSEGFITQSNSRTIEFDGTQIQQHNSSVGYSFTTLIFSVFLYRRLQQISPDYSLYPILTGFSYFFCHLHYPSFAGELIPSRYFSSTNEDEMCNFYMMYWSDGKILNRKTCFSLGPPFYYWSRDRLKNIPDKDASSLAVGTSAKEQGIESHRT